MGKVYIDKHSRLPDAAVVFQMLDNNLYMARTDEGGLVPICRRPAGDYHIDGDLVLAPKELQYTTFCCAKPFFEEAGSRKQIVITSIPRYLVDGCCEDLRHGSNRKEADFRPDLELAVMEVRKNVRDFCFRQGIRNTRVVGPWRELKEQGDQVWRDAVHLTDSSYGIIANLVLQSNSELSSKPEVPSSRLGKRPRDDHQQWSGRGRPGPFWQARGRRRY